VHRGTPGRCGTATATLRTTAAALAVVFLASVPPLSPARQAFTSTPVATGLAIPTRLGFPPDGSGRIFFLELQTGNVRIIESDTLRAEPWTHLGVSAGGERGLLGLAFDPGFPLNGFVYLYYTAAGPTVMNRVVRLTDSGGVAGSAMLTLYESPVETPCGTTFYHNAGALVCPSPGELFISTGENGCVELAGRPDDPRGKILRVDPRIAGPDNAVAANAWFDDGDPATGNDDRIFAAGLRNPFGMSVDPADSRVYVTENGPDCNDEVNRISNGNDYGWRPECSTGPEHCACSRDSPWSGPLWSVTPTVAPTGIVVMRGTSRYPVPPGTLMFTSYNDGLIRQGVFHGDDSLGVSVFLNPGVGALLDIALGPDSFLYVTTNQAIYRIEPLANGVAGRPPAGEAPRILVSSGPEGGTATIRYEAGAGGPVVLEMFDVTGRVVLRRVDRSPGPGTRVERVGTDRFSSGVYFFRVTTAAEVLTAKLSIIR